MTRTRWLSAEWGLTVRQLSNALKAAQFTGRSSEGFVIERVRKDSIEARYIQRVELTEVVIDPFGKESSFERLSFNEQPFVVSALSPGLQLKDGSRSLQPFFALLSQITDFRFTVKPISVNVDAWLTALARVAPGRLVSDAVQVGSIAFNDGSIARAVVKSGRGDARAAVKEIVSGKPYEVEKIRLRSKMVSKASAVLSSNCSVITKGFSSHDELALLDAMHEALRDVIERGPR